MDWWMQAVLTGLLVAAGIVAGYVWGYRDGRPR